LFRLFLDFFFRDTAAATSTAGSFPGTSENEQKEKGRQPETGEGERGRREETVKRRARRQQVWAALGLLCELLLHLFEFLSQLDQFLLKGRARGFLLHCRHFNGLHIVGVLQGRHGFLREREERKREEAESKQEERKIQEERNK
jgi:hypothetical protein